MIKFTKTRAAAAVALLAALAHHIGMATTPALYRKLTYKTPEDFEFLKKFVESEITKWSPVIKAAGQYAD